MKNQIASGFIALMLCLPLSATTLSYSKDGREGIGVIRGERLHKSQNLPRDLFPGDIVITSPSSSARINLRGNGKIFVAPETELIIREVRDDGIQMASLISGEIFFTTLEEGDLSKRAPGAILNLRDDPKAHQGEQFVMTYRPDKKQVEVLKGEHKMIELVDYSFISQ